MTKEEKFYNTFIVNLDIQFNKVKAFLPFVSKNNWKMDIVVPKKKNEVSDRIWNLEIDEYGQKQSTASGYMDHQNMLSDQIYVQESHNFDSFE